MPISKVSGQTHEPMFSLVIYSIGSPITPTICSRKRKWMPKNWCRSM